MRLEELQVDRISLQRDIRKHQIEEIDASEELKEYNRGQLGKLEDRWETDRMEGETDWAKRPLLEYEEWRAIDAVYGESSQNTGHLDAQEHGVETARWGNWQAKTIDEQWS